MNVLLLTVSTFWALLSVHQALSIPLEDAPLNTGDPGGSSAICKEHEYNPRGKSYCCDKCMQGYRVEEDCKEHGRTKCVPCEEGTFMDSANSSPYCEACNMCLLQNGQIELSSCRKDRDVQCGCPPDQYRSGKYDGDRTFVCEECGTCQNGTITLPCTENKDTFCRCHRGFFFEEAERTCRPCAQCDGSHCEHDCPPVAPLKHPENSSTTWIWLAVVAVVMVVAASFAAACLVQYFRNRGQSLSFPDITGHIPKADALVNNSSKPEHLTLLPGITAHVADGPSVLNMDLQQFQTALPMPDITKRTPSHHSSKVLYAILENVPVRHWREFVRRLGLSDHIIDTSEQDYRYYKDSQYRMLQAWTNLEGSSIDQLYRVLREMNLGGCIEKIEEKIEERL